MSSPTSGDLLTSTSGSWSGAFTHGYRPNYDGTNNWNFSLWQLGSNSGWYSNVGGAQPTEHSIKYYYGTGEWADAGSNNPVYLTSTPSFAATTSVSGYPSTLYIWQSSGSLLNAYTIPSWGLSGPNVSSITVTNQNSGTRNFTVTHTGTLSASDITYFIDGTDITTLGSPNTPITNLQTTSTGSTFDSYTVQKAGQHTVKIADEILQFYVPPAQSNSGFSNQRLIDNNITVTWPTTTADWLSQSNNVFQDVTITNSLITLHGQNTNGSGSVRVDEWLRIEKSYRDGTVGSNYGYKWYIIQHYYYPTQYATAQIGYWDPVTNLSLTITPNPQSEMLYNNNFTFDFATQAQSPQPNGSTVQSGKGSNYDDRFPLITTNLFNRQRSVYAIGMTHKDTWDLFL